VTVNEDELQPVPFDVVTEIGPLKATQDTVARISESETTVKPAGPPLKVTLVAPLNLVPMTSILVPAGPLVAANELISGAEGVKVNGSVPVPVPLGVVTEIGPLAAPAGTVAWSSESESTLKLAAAPLNVTPVASVKFAPVMSTLVPAAPFAGVNDLTTGVVTTASSTSRSSKFAETEHPPA
jgi:hypothetical protein